MRIEIIILIVAVCILGVVAIVWLTIDGINARNKKIVLANSQRLKLLKLLNSNYSFHDISDTYSYVKHCNSKANFDKTDITEYFSYIILEDEERIKHLLTQINNNRNNYEKYCIAFEDIKNREIPFDNSIKLSEERFNNIELKLYEKNKLNPVIDFTITVTKKYVSPQGRNHYSDYIDFDYRMTVKQYNRALLEQSQKEQRKLTKEYQRSLMTDSLRYDVMKRDKFRCVLCGASANAPHFATLHVDHIIPLAKGGKTVMNNLRTLCDRCNLGKRDKYDKYELN